MKTIILLTLLTSGIFSSFDGSLKLEGFKVTQNENGKIRVLFGLSFNADNHKIKLFEDEQENKEPLSSVKSYEYLRDFNYPIYKPRLIYQDQIESESESESSFDEETNTLKFSNQNHLYIEDYVIEIKNNKAENFIDIILKPTLITFENVNATAEKQILL